MSELILPYDINIEAECRVDWINNRVKLTDMQKQYIAFQIKEAVTYALSQANEVSEPTSERSTPIISTTSCSHGVSERNCLGCVHCLRNWNANYEHEKYECHEGEHITYITDPRNFRCDKWA